MQMQGARGVCALRALVLSSDGIIIAIFKACASRADLFVLILVFLQLLVTNTVPQKIHEQKCTKIKTIDISLMFAEAIRRIYHGESMSYLFRNIPMED